MFTPETINKITNVCGLIVAICGALVGLNIGGVLLLSTTAVSILTAVGAIAGAIIGYFTSKSTLVTK
jgi:hypothetical protein